MEYIIAIIIAMVIVAIAIYRSYKEEEKIDKLMKEYSNEIDGIK